MSTSPASISYGLLLFGLRTGKVALFSDMAAERTMVKVDGFTVDELFDAMPPTLAQGLVNPAPPQPPKQE